MLPTLCEGGFVERGDNLLAFGLPGRGKTHLVCAIGHELIQRGYRVLFTATFALVQRLLAAKRDLRLEKELADARRATTRSSSTTSATCSRAATRWRFSSPSSPSATSVASVIITSNVVFSEWDRIFKDPMTTAAAIDRLVHHSVILEMTGTSIRADAADQAKREASTTVTATKTGKQSVNEVDGEV